MAGHKSKGTGGQVGSSLVVVPPKDIPEGQPTPLDDPMLLFKLSQKMKKLCVENKGKGLSAVQVGVPWDLFVAKDLPKHIGGDDGWGTFLRCEYQPIGDLTHKSIEGCLSLKAPDGRLRLFRVNRHSKIWVKGLRLIDKPDLALVEFNQILDLKNDAIVFQHEIDHNLGILISDIGEEVLLWR